MSTHPLLQAILHSLADELAMYFSTSDTVSWTAGPHLCETHCSRVLEHDSRLTVHIAVDAFYLDAEVNRLIAEVVSAGVRLKATAPLTAECAQLADELQKLDDIVVGVHAWLSADDRHGDPVELGEHFERIRTEEEWFDMLENHILPMVQLDEEWGESQADGMSNSDTGGSSMDESETTI